MIIHLLVVGVLASCIIRWNCIVYNRDILLSDFGKASCTQIELNSNVDIVLNGKRVCKFFYLWMGESKKDSPQNIAFSIVLLFFL